MTTNINEPTPEFTRFLEWQVTSALRRQTRFAEPPRRGVTRYLGTAAVIVASMLVGAGGVAAASRIQNNQQKQVLLAEAQGEVRIAEMQLALAQQTAADTKKRADVGMAPPEDAAAAAQEVQHARLALSRVRLNVDEVNASGKPVQDDLTAPLVGGRDFVIERMQLDEMAANLRASSASERLKKAKTRFDVGLADDVELAEAQTAVARAGSEAAAIRDQIALRRRFLAGTLTAEAATSERLLLAARAELRIAEIEMSAASKRYDWLTKKAQVGAGSEADLLKARLDVLSRQQDIAKLRERIRALEAGK